MPHFALAQRSPLVRVVVFLGIAVTLWMPLAWPFYRLSGQGKLPGGDLIPTAMLYGVFLVLLPLWQRRVHGLRQPWQTLGFTGGRRLGQGFLVGLGIGTLSILALASIQLVLGWAVPNIEALANPPWIPLLLGGALTALAVGWSEEVLFRGWLLGELERGFSAPWALGINSLVFAIAHFIKPLAVMVQMLPQFLGLLLLGMTLVWARRVSLRPYPRQTSLGPAVGLHSGLVWMYYVLNVGHLLEPTGRVPPWVTGLDGNPLAGLLGLTLLLGLALGFRRWVAQSRLA